MTARSRLWHTEIRTTLTKRPEAVLGMTNHLWRLLAGELTPIIGSRGFKSLYARSCSLTRIDFPWLVNDQLTAGTDFSFTQLSRCLARQNVTEASEGSARLLITFYDTLALLIGESMADTIISDAWSDTTSLDYLEI